MSAIPEPDGPGRSPDDPLDRLGGAALSNGDVPVRVRGVRDGAHLDGLITAMRAIRGVGTVTLRAYESVHEPVLVLRTTRPVAIASELRTGLGRQVTSCVVSEGRIELELEGGGPRTAGRRPRPAGSDRGAPPRPRDGEPVPPPILGAWQGPARPGDAGARDDPRPGRRTPGSPGAWAPRPDTATDAATAAPADDPAPTTDPAGSAGPESEEGLRSAIDAIDSLSVLTFDTDIRFVRTAGAMHDRYDHVTADLLGRHPRELVGAAGWATLAPGYEGALRGRTTVLETPSPDGRRRYEATFRPLHEGGRVVGGTVTLIDVTAERRDERRLTELRDVFASAFDRSPLGQALLSPEGEWMRVNEALRRLFDRADESLVGTNLRDLTHPDDRDREEALMRSVRVGEQDGYDIEKRVVRGDGVTIAVHARMTAIRTQEARLRGFIAHVDDSDHWAAGRG